MDFYRPDSLQGVLEALDSVYRAFRAWKFYPKGHPSRKNSIKLAYASMQSILDGNDLSLVCGRSGFSLPEHEPFKESSLLSVALSYEFFIRRIQKITFLRDLHPDDLLDLIRIITLSPDDVQQAGGVDNLLVEHGVRTIWVNEFDFSAIHIRRQVVEASGIVPKGVDELENGAGIENSDGLEPSASDMEGPDSENELRATLARLAATRDEEIYRRLVHQAITCAEVIRSRNELALLLPMVVLLADHVGDVSRGGNLTEYARLGLEQLTANSEMIAFLLDRVAVSDGIGKNTVLTVLKGAGTAGVGLTVEKFSNSENKAERKVLASLLLEIGEQAVPAILAMMGDKRWQVIRNLAGILGDIGSPEAVEGLRGILPHSDCRVGKEAIRSLAKIGDKDAESAIISVIQGINSLLLPQAVASLGGMKSRSALAALMQLLGEKNLFLETLPLKLDILTAIAMIGDSSVVPGLEEMLLSRHLFARNRWMSLKVALATCLGKLGDPRAVPALENLAHKSGELGRTCTDAIVAIQRTGAANEGAR